MLVLSRKTQDTIVIGSDIRITVLVTSNNRVQIGIEAPDEVRVLRGELVSDENKSQNVVSSALGDAPFKKNWTVPQTTLSA
jgi:carbon storage regulator